MTQVSTFILIFDIIYLARIEARWEEIVKYTNSPEIDKTRF